MTSFNYCIPLSLLLAAGILRADEPKTSKAANKPEYRRPELLAIAWQQTKSAEADDPNMPVWRPDGRLMEQNEFEWIRDDVQHFNCHQWETTTELRPLVLVFRIDERAKSPQTLWGRVSDGKKPKSIYVEFPSGFAHRSTPQNLAKTAIVPRRVDMPSWPDVVDIELRVPVGEPELAISFDRLPTGDLKIDEGVRWYVDPGKGQKRVNGMLKTGFPAAVMEFDSRVADPLLTVWQELRLKDGRVLRGGYAKQPWTNETAAIHVSEPLEESNPIVSGKFAFIRHRLERYEKLPTRLDLKPGGRED